MGEARIATTLHLAKVTYQYEAEFPILEEQRGRSRNGYYPGFYLPDEAEEAASVHGGIWLEHFANEANGELPGRWDEDEPGATAKYRERRRWKEQLHASLETRFTFTEFADFQRCMKGRTSFPDLLLHRLHWRHGRRGGSCSVARLFRIGSAQRQAPRRDADDGSAGVKGGAVVLH